jgi:CRP-like cAMP-binding protein
MAKLAKAATACSVHLVWSGMSKSFRQALEKCDTITSKKDWFDTLDNAIQHCHNKISERILFNQNRWVETHPLFDTARSQTYLRIDSDPFASIMPLDEQRFGCPWKYCGRLPMKAYETLVWKPGSEKEIFLIYSGQVGVFHEVPEEGGKTKWGSPYAIYGRGWFLNRQALLHKANHTFGVALRDGEILFWNELQWNKMAREMPRMTNAIMKAIWTQEARDTELFEAETHSYVGAGDDDDDLEELEDRILDEIHDHHANYEETKATSAKGRAHALDGKLITNVLEHHYEEEFNAQHNELRNEIEGIAIAEACENLGLFLPVDPSEEIAFPKLPYRIDDDVEVGFTTFAEAQANGEAGLKVDNLVSALTYAGIYDFALNEFDRAFLSRTEFHQLCRRLLLAPLSQTMAKTLVAKFHEHNKEHNAHHHDTKTMDRCSFVILMKETFNCDISADYVDGIANLWGDDHGNRVNEDVYLAVVSRFVVRHMKDWLILKGTRDLRGTHAGSNLEETTITPQMLTSANPDLSLEMAEEMIWSSSYCKGLGSGKSVDYRMCACILQAIPSKPNKIPPLPQHLSLKEYHVKLAAVELTVVDIDRRKVEEEVLPDWLRAAVIDFRSTDKTDVKCKYHTNQLFKKDMHKSQQSAQSHTPRQKATTKSPTQILRESQGIQAKVWCLLEDPGSSRCAANFSIIMAVLILLSAITLFLEPLISPKNSYVSPTEKDVWFGCELFFTVLFTSEYLLKLWSCTAAKPRLRFLKEPMNICDIVAVMPFYIDQLIDADKEEFRLFRIFRLLRLSRLARLGRLAKKSATFAPIAMILVVIWGIYMQNGLKEK